MTTYEFTTTVLLWIILGAFNYHKMTPFKGDDWPEDDFMGFIIVCAFLLAPIFFLGAIIRQVIVEKWK